MLRRAYIFKSITLYWEIQSRLILNNKVFSYLRHPQNENILRAIHGFKVNFLSSAVLVSTKTSAHCVRGHAWP